MQLRSHLWILSLRSAWAPASVLCLPCAHCLLLCSPLLAMGLRVREDLDLALSTPGHPASSRDEVQNYRYK